MSDIIIVILVIMPVVLVIAGLNYSHKKRKRKAGDALSGYLYTLTHKLGVNHSFRKNLLHQLVIVDANSGRLVVVSHKDSRFSYELFSLDAIKSMKVVNVKQTFKTGEGGKRTEIITTQVGLEICFTKPEREVFLVCYDHRDQNIFQMAEMKNEARQLHEDISRHLSTQSIRA